MVWSVLTLLLLVELLAWAAYGVLGWALSPGWLWVWLLPMLVVAWWYADVSWAGLFSERTRELSLAFGAPVMMHARLRDGSLRHAAREEGAKVLLYEAGEAWRMDSWAVDAGVRGVRRVLAALEMTEPVEEEPDDLLVPDLPRAAGRGEPHAGIVVGDEDGVSAIMLSGTDRWHCEKRTPV